LSFRSPGSFPNGKMYSSLSNEAALRFFTTMARGRVRLLWLAFWSLLVFSLLVFRCGCLLCWIMTGGGRYSLFLLSRVYTRYDQPYLLLNKKIIVVLKWLCHSYR
jgi:hypothetical protein